MSKMVEIKCYNCDEKSNNCMLCNGAKKIMVTQNFAQMMGYTK